jgi:hypothetical protein
VKVKLIIAGVLALALPACGQRAQLTPKAGNSLPVKPEAAIKTPTADALLTPDGQASPKRSDEQLLKSEQRRDDKFDLPPPG